MDVETARNLGYSGKFAIHPAQIDIINSMFTPGPERWSMLTEWWEPGTRLRAPEEAQPLWTAG